MPRVHRCRALGCHNVVEWPARYCAQHKSLEATADEKNATIGSTTTSHAIVQSASVNSTSFTKQNNGSTFVNWCLIEITIYANTAKHVEG